MITLKTLAEIAERLGVSTATVSRVLNGDPAVAEATKDKILAEIRESGVEQRPRRRSAVRRNEKTAMIIAAQLQNPIILGFVDGIRKRLSEAGIRSVISLSDYDSSTECDALGYASGNGFSGIFMLNAVENTRLVGLVSRAKQPVIFVNRFLRTLDTDVVTVDNYRCGYMATSYLIGHGHRRVAHIAGPATSMTCRERTRGYIDAMKDAGLEVSAGFIYTGDRSYRCGLEFGEKLCAMPQSERFTAVFSTTGLMAAGMVDRLRAGGIKVPEDISVICNDDYSRDYIPCPMDFNTFAQDPIVMGQTAAELMLERSQNREAPPRRVIFSPVLTERNSVRRLF